MVAKTWKWPVSFDRGLDKGDEHIDTMEGYSEDAILPFVTNGWILRIVYLSERILWIDEFFYEIKHSRELSIFNVFTGGIIHEWSKWVQGIECSVACEKSERADTVKIQSLFFMTPVFIYMEEIN